jgi:hypothetical protein
MLGVWGAIGEELVGQAAVGRCDFPKTRQGQSGRPVGPPKA